MSTQSLLWFLWLSWDVSIYARATALFCVGVLVQDLGSTSQWKPLLLQIAGRVKLIQTAWRTMNSLAHQQSQTDPESAVWSRSSTAPHWQVSFPWVEAGRWHPQTSSNHLWRPTLSFLTFENLPSIFAYMVWRTKGMKWEWYVESKAYSRFL